MNSAFYKKFCKIYNKEKAKDKIEKKRFWGSLRSTIVSFILSKRLRNISEYLFYLKDFYVKATCCRSYLPFFWELLYYLV